MTGTCIEAASVDQLKSMWLDSSSWNCNDNAKTELSNLLSASVHAMYSANAVTPFTGDAKEVYDAVVLATQGTDPAYSITRSTAYAALSIVGTPSTTDCAALYSGATEGTLTTPLKPVVVCDGDLPASNPAPTPSPDTDKLYTHCLHQFSYARSYPDSGTLGLPLVGKEAAPLLLPIIATNSTTSWEHRARVVVGTRWGYATIFYVISMLATGFFAMDCTVLLLAELTRVDSYFAQNSIVEGNKNAMKEGMMTMLATFQAKRSFRWALAIILLLLEILLWVLLIGVPWGFGQTFKRPICESGDAEHWLPPLYATSKAGWKDDYDAFSLELIVLVSHLIVLIAVPISELAQRGTGTQGRRDRTGQGKLDGFTGVAVGSLRSAWWFALLAVGGLVFYVGQAIAAFRFGVAWAEAVTMDKHSEIAVGAMLYDHVNAILYLSLTIGLALASIIGRWLLAGLSCTSFTIFLIWVLLTVGAFIPPFFVSTYWFFFSFEGSKGQEDCQAVFGDDEEFAFARAACDIRAITYIVAICLLLVASLGPVVIGLWDYSRVVCLPRRRAWVNMPDYWRKLVDPANPKFRTFAPAPTPGGSLVVPLHAQPVTGQKAQTDFFNFSTRLTVGANDVQNV